jgi:hypothetical protein
MDIFLILLGIVSIGFVGIAFFTGSQNSDFDYNKEHIRIGEVVKKEYIPETILEAGQHRDDVYPDGFRGFRRMYPDYQDEEHYVHIQSEHQSEIIKVASKALFESVNKGDKVELYLKPKRFVVNPRNKLKIISIKKK